MRQDPAKVLAQSCTDFAGESARLIQTARERFRVPGQPEGFQLLRPPQRTLAHQHEVARVGYQHKTVAAPVPAHLIARRRQPGVIFDSLHLDHASFRNLPLAWSSLLHLLRRIEAEIGMARALIGKLADAEHLRLERRADGIEQVRQRPIT